MTRLLHAVLLMAVSGCVAQVAYTGEPPGEVVSPTPATPANPFSNEVYAEALRSASLKLRGKLPTSAEVRSVLEKGRTEYERHVDAFIASDDFLPTMHAHFSALFGMGDTTTTRDDPDSGVPMTVNLEDPANLATRLVALDLPWTGILNANYCVDDNLNISPCSGGTPASERAGVLTMQSWLLVYGKSVAFNFQRVSVAHQMFTCELMPTGDLPLARNNVPLGGMPFDDPADPPRIHAKYQGAMAGDEGEVACHGCHSTLISRRAAFAKFNVDGFYRPNNTIIDIENPADNGDKCFVVPPGLTVSDLKTCTDVTFDPNLDNCCYDPAFTDVNSSDAAACSTPSEDCSGTYLGRTFSGAREYTSLMLDGSVNDDAFYRCQTRRFFNYVLGVDAGQLGLQAAVGELPANVDPFTLEKYRSLFEHDDWNVRELLRAQFKGDEFLTSQKP